MDILVGTVLLVAAAAGFVLRPRPDQPAAPAPMPWQTAPTIKREYPLWRK